MKNFLAEFKKFALKGNVMDMAVGIIVGAAFTAIVTSLVNDILSPLLGLLVRIDFSDLQVAVAGVPFAYGKFIMAIINFLLVAFTLFLVIRGINKLNDMKTKEKPEEAPKTKKCPYCTSEIPVEAVRCPHCTSVLEKTVTEEA